VGTDANIWDLKQHKTMYNEEERLFMVQSVGCVHDAALSTGNGVYDFESDMGIVKPDIYFCNEDGSGMEGRVKICEDLGIEMVIAPREPSDGLAVRSSTSMKARLREMVLAEEKEDGSTEAGLVSPALAFEVAAQSSFSPSAEPIAESLQVKLLSLQSQLSDAQTEIVSAEAQKKKSVETWKRRAENVKKALEVKEGALQQEVGLRKQLEETNRALQAEKLRLAARTVAAEQSGDANSSEQQHLLERIEEAELALEQTRKRGGMALKKAHAERDELKAALQSVTSSNKELEERAQVIEVVSLPR
jgi:glycerol-3-phosphate cytidylyltransferase-like family protein